MSFKIYFGQKPNFNSRDRDMFSQKKYKCQFIMLTRKDAPVAILENRNREEGGWKVQHGFSTIYFNNLAETMNYCRQRFYGLDENKLEQ